MARGAEVVARWRRAVWGPAPVLPKWADALAEGWASLGGRARFALGVCAVIVLLAGASSWAAGVDQRWGGAPVTVLVAERTLSPGDPLDGLRAARLPPAAVPLGALEAVPDGAVLAFALPEGSVLTAAHLDARGPSAGLGAGLRAMPVPVEPGWSITEGGWVDVWVLGMDAEQARLVARRCPVLQVHAADDGGGTALVALPEPAVGPVAQGLAVGRVLLAHAPPPGQEGRC